MIKKDTTIRKIIASLLPLLLGILVIYHLTPSETSPGTNQGMQKALYTNAEVSNSSPSANTKNATAAPSTPYDNLLKYITLGGFAAEGILAIYYSSKKLEQGFIAYFTAHKLEAFIAALSATVAAGLVAYCCAIKYKSTIDASEPAVSRLLALIGLGGYSIAVYRKWSIIKEHDINPIVHKVSDDPVNVYLYLVAGVMIGMVAFAYASYGTWDANGCLPSKQINATGWQWLQRYIKSFFSQKELGSAVGFTAIEALVLPSLLLALGGNTTQYIKIISWESAKLCGVMLLAALCTIKLAHLMNSWCPGEATSLVGIFGALGFSAFFLSGAKDPSQISLANCWQVFTQLPYKWFIGFGAVLLIAYLYDVCNGYERLHLKAHLHGWEHVIRGVLWGIVVAARIGEVSYVLIKIKNIKVKKFIQHHIKHILLAIVPIGLAAVIYSRWNSTIYPKLSTLLGQKHLATVENSLSTIKEKATTFRKEHIYLYILVSGMLVGAIVMQVTFSQDDWDTLYDTHSPIENHQVIATGLTSAGYVGLAWLTGIHPVLFSWTNAAIWPISLVAIGVLHPQQPELAE